MTRWIRGLPWNLSHRHRSQPSLTAASSGTKVTPADYRQCDRCGHRNQHVGLLINKNNETKCLPNCATVRGWLNSKKEVGE